MASEIANLHLIQYVFDGTEHEVKVVLHGNSKKSNAVRYVRTKRSVVEDLKEVSATKKPKQSFHKVDVQKDGIGNAKSESDLPRNRAQAQNQRRGIFSKQVDSLILLMLRNSKRQQLGSPENAFIREVTGPELRVVLGFNWQLRDIVRFFANCTKFSVLGVDPTFNLGKFHQTVTTYSSLMLVDRKNKETLHDDWADVASSTKNF